MTDDCDCQVLNIPIVCVCDFETAERDTRIIIDFYMDRRKQLMKSLNDYKCLLKQRTTITLKEQQGMQ